MLIGHGQTLREVIAKLLATGSRLTLVEIGIGGVSRYQRRVFQPVQNRLRGADMVEMSMSMEQVGNSAAGGLDVMKNSLWFRAWINQ